MEQGATCTDIVMFPNVIGPADVARQNPLTSAGAISHESFSFSAVYTSEFIEAGEVQGLLSN